MTACLPRRALLLGRNSALPHRDVLSTVIGWPTARERRRYHADAFALLDDLSERRVKPATEDYDTVTADAVVAGKGPRSIYRLHREVSDKQRELAAKPKCDPRIDARGAPVSQPLRAACRAAP